jgi:hypothetical protein
LIESPFVRGVEGVKEKGGGGFGRAKPIDEMHIVQYD